METPHLFLLPEPSALEPAPSRPPTPPRTLEPIRNQVEMRCVDLDALLPPLHAVRDLWSFVLKLDLAPWLDAIKARENSPGRPSISPQILFALWLQATLDGIGSARRLEELCENHVVYQWICGGVGVNYHTLADFRVSNPEALENLFIQCVASLQHQGLVTMNQVSQDGMKVRASAGLSSFHRKQSLEECLEEAKEQLEALRAELEKDPGACSRREQAARERAATERKARVEAALKEVKILTDKKKDEDKEKARASTTDPDAHIMKMANSGFRPALNVQLMTDTASGVIIGVEVTNAGTDMGLLLPMVEQVEERFKVTPKEVLVDGGFAKKEDIETIAEKGGKVFSPVQGPRKAGLDGQERYKPQRGDSPSIIEWRERMSTEEAAATYRIRASVSEWVNALMRQRGLEQFQVRGTRKCYSIILWQVMVHNMGRSSVLLKAS